MNRSTAGRSPAFAADKMSFWAAAAAAAEPKGFAPKGVAGIGVAAAEEGNAGAAKDCGGGPKAAACGGEEQGIACRMTARSKDAAANVAPWSTRGLGGTPEERVKGAPGVNLDTRAYSSPTAEGIDETQWSDG